MTTSSEQEFITLPTQLADVSVEPTPNGTASADLFVHLRRLDSLLAHAVAVAEWLYGQEAARDPFRGLHLGYTDAERLLQREPGSAAFGKIVSWSAEPLAGQTPLGLIAATYALSPFDLDILMVAAAPEIDLRYELIYAYLQDDISKRRPNIELVLNLLCESADEKLTRRRHFGAEAPLRRHGLIRLLPDTNHLEPPLIAHYLKVDEQIVDVLVRGTGLGSRLAPWCALVGQDAHAAPLPWGHTVVTELISLITDAGEPPLLHLRGPCASSRALAAAVASELEVPLLTATLGRAPSGPEEFAEALRLLWREGWLYGAILYLDDVDGLDEARMERLRDELARTRTPVVLAGAQPWIPCRRHLGVVTIAIEPPSPAERTQCWRASLSTAGMALGQAELDTLAERFLLAPSQIEDAVRMACRRAGPVTLARIADAARAQTGHDLARLATSVQPIATWNDIVLPSDALAQLHEVCARVASRRVVLDEWGFDRKLGRGTGASVLFTGPSGTGKTMAAEIIANELGLGLYKIDLAGVISKYIGETEKNLDRIFTAAQGANVILFFDEAEALFGKRSEVRDAHDRYANIEIAYLLQKLEAYDGLAILATNMRGNLDEAFTRRLGFTVHFPFPDEGHRRRIWASIWPAKTPLNDDVDLDFLARRFALSGGNIKNVALTAAFLAADAPEAVSMAHLLHAVRREYQKLGKDLTDEDMNAEVGP